MLNYKSMYCEKNNTLKKTCVSPDNGKYALKHQFPFIDNSKIIIIYRELYLVEIIVFLK